MVRHELTSLYSHDHNTAAAWRGQKKYHTEWKTALFSFVLFQNIATRVNA